MAETGAHSHPDIEARLTALEEGVTIPPVEPPIEPEPPVDPPVDPPDPPVDPDPPAIPTGGRIATPLKWHGPMMPLRPETFADPTAERVRRANAIWTSDGLMGSYPTLYNEGIPHLFKDLDGNEFVQMFNPKGPGHLRAEHQFPYQQRAPQNDGPRGICDSLGASTMIHGHQILPSGMMGWLNIDLASRVSDVDIDGSMRTWFGPKSVPGVVQTDPTLESFTLLDRIAAGEKEFVGDVGLMANGSPGYFQKSTDIWYHPTNPDFHYVADRGHDRIAILSRSQQKIVAELRAPEPHKSDFSSVWSCRQMHGLGIEVCGVTSEGLWMFFQDGRPPRLDPIPNAFCIRGKDSVSDPASSRTYVLTLDLALYECNPITGSVLQVLEPQAVGTSKWTWLDVDVNGLIGPKNRIYALTSFGWNNHTGIGLIDPNIDGPATLIRTGNIHSHHNQMRRHDWTQGKYLWGMSIHHHMPVYLTAGVADSGWHIHRTYAETPNYIRDGYTPGLEKRHWAEDWFKIGTDLWENGKGDTPPLSRLFGEQGSGAIGWSVDMAQYGTKATMGELLALVPEEYRTGYTPEEWDALVMFAHHKSTKWPFEPEEQL